MGNAFTFPRPRGIQGNYAVEITLELLPTQGAVVVAQQSCQQSGTNNRKPVVRAVKAVKRYEEANGTRVVIYGIWSIVAGDAITVDVDGGLHDPLQRIVYTATMQGFVVKRVTFHTIADAWLAESNAIALIDRDAQADNGREEEAIPAIALQVLDVRHGFQIRRLVGTINGSEDTPQQLL